MEWTAQRVRETFLRFFKGRGHAIIPSASLIPENDPSVLFTTAGMHPLVPYLMGQVHPAGKRLANVQKCIRTGDIDEVGDNRHLTFFEMLGNWSLGDYFKREAITWSYELLTGNPFSISHEIEKGRDRESTNGTGGFGVDPNRIAVSVFAGDSDAPRDEESVAIWKSLGIPDARIAYLGKDDNWWPAGGKNPGPQGPDTEMFVWIGEGSAPEAFDPKDGRWVEVWNDVFMEYQRTAVSGQESVGEREVPTPSPTPPRLRGTGHSPSQGEGEKRGETTPGVFSPLAQKNVDTGMGLERMLTVLTGKQTVYETDLFAPILGKINELIHTPSNSPSARGGEKERRIIADHLRAATFILGDPFGVAPSNVDQGYVLRKLIRRAVRAGRSVGISKTETALSAVSPRAPSAASATWTPDIAGVIIAHYRDAYPELEQHRSRILFELREEEERFNETLDRGLKRIAALGDRISGTDAFDLYQSYGFPPELTAEILAERGAPFDRAAFDAALQEHQEKSRAATGQRFQGGLADHSDQSIRYHTATHLTHQALREVLGDHVLQKGSNITLERMRFDFSHPQKLTTEDIVAVERLVQEQIDADLPVHYELMDAAEAKAAGVIGLFDDAYAKLGGKVKVYFVGVPDRGFFSKEICGGPHVAHTGLIGKFRITKEEAISRGVRRIRAVVEPPGDPMEIAVVKSHD